MHRLSVLTAAVVIAAIMVVPSYGQGEDCSDPIVIGALPASIAGDTVGRTHDVLFPSPACTTTLASPDIVYSYTPAADETVSITTCNGPGDTVLAVYNDATCTDAENVGCNDDAGCDCGLGGNYQSEILGLALTGGTTYYIAIEAWGNGDTTDEVTFVLDIAVDFTGTCCDTATFACTDGVLEAACTGTWGCNVTCADNLPGACQLGACCEAVNGTCADDVLESDCAGADETWSGGALCANTVCATLPRGACCDRLIFVCGDDVLARSCVGPNDEWTDGVACADLDPACDPPPPPIPTVTEWGLIVMTLLGCVLGTILFRRGRVVKTA